MSISTTKFNSKTLAPAHDVDGSVWMVKCAEQVSEELRNN